MVVNCGEVAHRRAVEVSDNQVGARHVMLPRDSLSPARFLHHHANIPTNHARHRPLPPFHHRCRFSSPANIALAYITHAYASFFPPRTLFSFQADPYFHCPLHGQRDDGRLPNPYLPTFHPPAPLRTFFIPRSSLDLPHPISQTHPFFPFRLNMYSIPPRHLNPYTILTFLSRAFDYHHPSRHSHSRFLGAHIAICCPHTLPLFFRSAVLQSGLD